MLALQKVHISFDGGGHRHALPVWVASMTHLGLPFSVGSRLKRHEPCRQREKEGRSLYPSNRDR